jgi:hypothetical protein
VSRLGSRPRVQVVELWRVSDCWPAEILEAAAGRHSLTRAYLYHLELGQRALRAAAAARGLPTVEPQILVHDLRGLGTRHLVPSAIGALLEVRRPLRPFRRPF